MAFNDTFMVSLLGCVVIAVLAIFVGRDPALEAAKDARQRGEIPAADKIAVPGD
jgi:hypothetical protein